MKEIVKTTNLTKRYGDICCVNNLDMSVKEGKIYGFLGPNGAGKSTTLKMLLGLVHPTAGEIDMFGQRFTEKKPDFNFEEYRLLNRITVVLRTSYSKGKLKNIYDHSRFAR